MLNSIFIGSPCWLLAQSYVSLQANQSVVTSLNEWTLNTKWRRQGWILRNSHSSIQVVDSELCQQLLTRAGRLPGPRIQVHKELGIPNSIFAFDRIHWTSSMDGASNKWQFIHPLFKTKVLSWGEYTSKIREGLNPYLRYCGWQSSVFPWQRQQVEAGS